MQGRMNEHIGSQLGRRERQLVEALYKLGSATVAEVLENLPDPPSYSTVRAMLGLLEGKGYVRHKRDGMRYVYTPAIAPAKARQSALRQLVSTFFEGSPLAAAAALLEMSDHKLSTEEREHLATLIARREKEGQ
jgi:BlaI family transcriptional regulator, penicillinase repressor